MTTEKNTRFTVITNNDIETKEIIKPKSNSGYQTNPFYERLVKFANDSHRKRFSVEDLLR